MPLSHTDYHLYLSTCIEVAAIAEGAVIAEQADRATVKAFAAELGAECYVTRGNRVTGFVFAAPPPTAIWKKESQTSAGTAYAPKRSTKAGLEMREKVQAINRLRLAGDTLKEAFDLGLSSYVTQKEAGGIALLEVRAFVRTANWSVLVLVPARANEKDLAEHDEKLLRHGFRRLTGHDEIIATWKSFGGSL